MAVTRIIRWCLYTFAFVLPFFVIRSFLFPYVGGKTLYIRGVAFITVFLTTWLLVSNKEQANHLLQKIQFFYKSIIARLVSLGVLLLGVSTFFAFNTSIAFFGEPQRAEGFLTLFSMYVLFVMFGVFFEKKNWQTFFAFTSATSILIFVITLIQFLGGEPRPKGLQGNSTFLGGYFIFTLFAGLELWFNKQKYKILGLVGFISAVFGIVLSGTRAGIFGIIFALGVSTLLVILYGKKDQTYHTLRKVSIWVFSIILTLGLLIGFTANAPLWKNIPGIGRVAETNIENVRNSSRALFYEISLKSFADYGLTRTLVGWGWDNYTFFYQDNYIPEIFNYDKAVADRSHNQFIDMLIMKGVFGLLAYLALWFVYLKKIFIRLKKKGLRVLPYVFFTGTYFVFLFFTFDLLTTLLGFYALLAYMEHEQYA